MKLFAKAHKFLNYFIPTVENKSQQIWNYGKSNQLPNELLKFVVDSGIGKRCITKMRSYIAAEGFTDSELNLIMVNEKQTAYDLLYEAAEYMAYFNGCAFHIARQAVGGVGGIKIVPFQCVRKRLDGNFEVNLTYGQPNYSRKDSKIFAAYGGAKIDVGAMQMQLANPEIKDNGEILYVYSPGADNQHYPIPDYFAGIEDIRTSAELSKFDLETVINGFMTSAILSLVGDIDNVNKDEKGKTEQDYVNDEVAKFSGETKNADGTTNRMKLLVLNAPTKDEMPVLQTFDSKAIFDASNSKRDLIDRVVCRLFGIHPCLMGFADAQILGNTQSMANASIELNKVVAPMQRLLESAFETMMPEKGWKISEYTPINYVSPELLSKMTEDEIRVKLLGLDPIVRELPTEQEKILATLNSLSPLLAAEIVKNMPTEELLGLVGIKYNGNADTNES